MLETPSIRRYSSVSFTRFLGVDMGSKNPFGADNQQERLGAMSWQMPAPDIENPQRPNADHLTGHIGSSCEMK
jgi:hypothetical protein